MLILFTGVYCYFYGQEFFIFIVYSMTFHGVHIIPILCSNIIEIISGLEIIHGPIWGSIIAVGISGGLYRSKLFKGWILEENNKRCSSEGRRTLPIMMTFPSDCLSKTYYPDCGCKKLH